MTEHQFLAVMILLQTLAFAVSFAYLARISHKMTEVVQKVSEDTRYLMRAVDEITRAVERIADRLASP